MFHYSLRVIDEPKMSEIRILKLCHKKSILVDIYRQSLLTVLVVLFAFNRKLRRKSLFLVINMAFSDTMLGAVCLPLYVYLIARPAIQLWENAYERQMRLDIFVHVLYTIFTHSSLISAVFRFYAIFWPLKHRRL